MMQLLVPIILPVTQSVACDLSWLNYNNTVNKLAAESKCSYVAGLKANRRNEEETQSCGNRAATTGYSRTEIKLLLDISTLLDNYNNVHRLCKHYNYGNNCTCLDLCTMHGARLKQY